MMTHVARIQKVSVMRHCACRVASVIALFERLLQSVSCFPRPPFSGGSRYQAQWQFWWLYLEQSLRTYQLLSKIVSIFATALVICWCRKTGVVVVTRHGDLGVTKAP